MMRAAVWVLALAGVACAQGGPLGGGPITGGGGGKGGAAVGGAGAGNNPVGVGHVGQGQALWANHSGDTMSLQSEIGAERAAAEQLEVDLSNYIVASDGQVQMVGLSLTGNSPPQGQNPAHDPGGTAEHVGPLPPESSGEPQALPAAGNPPAAGKPKEPKGQPPGKDPNAPVFDWPMFDIDLSGLDNGPAAMVSHRRPPTREGQRQAIQDAALQELRNAVARVVDPNAAANRGLAADQMRTRDTLGLAFLGVLDGRPPDAEGARFVQDHKGEMLTLIDSVSPGGTAGESPLQQSIEDAERSIAQACKDALSK